MKKSDELLETHKFELSEEAQEVNLIKGALV